MARRGQSGTESNGATAGRCRETAREVSSVPLSPCRGMILFLPGDDREGGYSRLGRFDLPGKRDVAPRRCLCGVSEKSVHVEFSVIDVALAPGP
ncbi:hypothetical protein GCM10009525_41620 [Streptosporangium amethystogenes subsp. fukuiense]